MDATTEALPSHLHRLGRWLSDARESRNLSLADVEESTRIRRKFLSALESGDWDQLPSEVVGRGFLRNYAAFLGLNPQDALDRLRGVEVSAAPAAAPPAKVAEPDPAEDAPQDHTEAPATPTPPSSIPPATAGQDAPEYGLLEEPLFEPRRVPWLRIIGIVILVLLLAAVGVASWAYWNNPQLLTYIGLLQPTDTPTPTTQPEPAVTRITATPTDTPTLAPTPTETATVRATRTSTATPSATPTFRATPASGLELFLHSLDRCWLDVYTDGKKAFEGLLERGEETAFLADSEIRLTIGDAGSLEVVLNGQPLGLLGEEDEIIWVTWVLDGGQILQMSFTPTPIPDQAAQPTEPEQTAVATATPES